MSSNDQNPFDEVYATDIMVLGIGCILFSDEGFGVRVVEKMEKQYEGKPGDLYRLEGDAIPERIRAKNSLHQVDFLEALTLCQALDHVPKTVIIGVEPQDIETTSLDLTPPIQAQVEPVIEMVLAELERLGVSWEVEN